MKSISIFQHVISLDDFTNNIKTLSLYSQGENVREISNIDNIANEKEVVLYVKPMSIYRIHEDFFYSLLYNVVKNGMIDNVNLVSSNRKIKVAFERAKTRIKNSYNYNLNKY